MKITNLDDAITFAGILPIASTLLAPAIIIYGLAKGIFHSLKAMSEYVLLYNEDTSHMMNWTSQEELAEKAFWHALEGLIGLVPFLGNWGVYALNANLVKKIILSEVSDTPSPNIWGR